MSDQDDPQFDDPAFDDPAFDEVRDLLAHARVTDPVPDDVAARLEATLASLAAERRARPAAVVPLRRRAGRYLVAAAAVVLIGGGAVGIAQRADLTTASDDDKAASAERDTAADSGADSGPLPPSAAVPEASSQLLTRAGKRALRLDSDTFALDAAGVMRSLAVQPLDGLVAGDTASEVTPGTGASDSPSPPSAYSALEAPAVVGSTEASGKSTSRLQALLAECPGPEPTDSVTLPATLDGNPVALVFRPPTDSAQEVEAWSCDGTSLLAAASVPH